MVNGHSSREQASPDWLTDIEIGERAAQILADPESNRGPVLSFSAQDRATV